MIIDWPHACHGGPLPRHVLIRSPAGRTASQDAITAIICAAAGHYTERALRPPPPGIPAARTH